MAAAAAPFVFPEVPINIHSRIIYQPPGQEPRNGVVTAVAGNMFTIRLDDQQIVENVPRDHLRKAPVPANIWPKVPGKVNNLAAQLKALNAPTSGNKFANLVAQLKALNAPAAAGAGGQAPGLVFPMPPSSVKAPGPLTPNNVFHMGHGGKRRHRKSSRKTRSKRRMTKRR